MKFIIELLLLGGFKRVFGSLYGLAQAEFIARYAGFVDHARGVFILGLFTVFSLMLIFIGFVLVHIGLYLYLPLEASEKVMLLLALGSVYLLVPFSILMWAFSKSRWMKISGVEHLLAKIPSNKK
jgi:hypothetical protein